MPTSILIFAGGLLALLSWGSHAQDTGLQPRLPPIDPAQQAALRSERIEGCWQLTRVVQGDIALRGSDFAGYMVVTPDYLSIEMHLMLETAHPSGGQRPFFQGGVHRWRFAGETGLETSTLIGTSNVNVNEAWGYEPVGTKRLFTMFLSERSLVLERKGETRMEFRKLVRMPFPGRKLELDPAQVKAAEAAGAKPPDQPEKEEPRH